MASGSSGYPPSVRTRARRPELSTYMTLQSTLYDLNMEMKDPPMYSSGNRQPICTVTDIKHLPCKKLGMDLVVNKGQSDA